MRISDWSSDVCSSDLAAREVFRAEATLVVLVAKAAVQLELLAELDRVERINRLVGERSGLDAGRDEIEWAGIDALRIGDADRIMGRRCTVGEALHIALRQLIILIGHRRAEDEGVVQPH